MGMNRATLYLYFKDKDSIYFKISLRKGRLVDGMTEYGDFEERKNGTEHSVTRFSGPLGRFHDSTIAGESDTAEKRVPDQS